QASSTFTTSPYATFLSPRTATARCGDSEWIRAISEATCSARTTTLPTYTVPSSFTVIASWRWASGTGSPLTVGRFTGTPLTSAGTTTMKMISRTRQTSTSGVTLMFDSSAAFDRMCMANPPARFDTHIAPDATASDPLRFDHPEHPAGRNHALDFVAATFQQRGVLAGGAFAAAEHDQHV